MALLKVDNIINNSLKKNLGSLGWFLGVKIDSENSNFAYSKCMALCQFTKCNDLLEVCWFLAKNLAF